MSKHLLKLNVVLMAALMAAGVRRLGTVRLGWGQRGQADSACARNRADIVICRWG